MILNIPFDVNRHVLFQKTVRGRAPRGGVINLPSEYKGNRCLVLLELYEDKNEGLKWLNQIVHQTKTSGYNRMHQPEYGWP